MSDEYQMDVPLPTAPKRATPESTARLATLRTMPVGASVFYALDATKAASLYAMVAREGRRYSKRRLVENGVEGYRIWRTA